MTEKKNHRTVLLDYLFCHNVRWAFQYRIQQVTQKWPRVSRYWLSRKYGLEVGPTAIIGKGIYLSHPYNIMIGHNVVIGDNVNLHKGCTIGNSWRVAAPEVPSVETVFGSVSMQCLSAGLQWETM